MMVGKQAMLAVGIVAMAGSATLFAEAPKSDAGRDMVGQRCQGCHDLATVTAHRGSSSDWQEVVARMSGYGAVLNDAEKATIIAYLAANYGPQGAAAKPGAPAEPQP